MLDNENVRAEYKTIVNAPLPDVFGQFEAIILANNVRLKTIQVDEIQIARNYEENLGDICFVHLFLGVSTLAEYVLPYLANLQIELHRYSSTSTGKKVTSIAPTYWTYNAYLHNPPNPDLINRQRGQKNPELNEIGSQIPLTFQLVDPTLDEMRQAYVYGSYYNVSTTGNVKEIIRNIYSYGVDSGTSVSTLTSATYTGVRGVHITDPDNTDNITSDNPITIKQGTKLTKVARIIQQTRGVYNTGLGRYYQDGYWFIYPLYNHERFSNTTKRAIIYNVPADELAAPERSFKVRSGEITIFATGNSNALDRTTSISAEQGNAYGYTKASNLIDGMTTRSNNKATPNADTTNVKYSVLGDSNGLNNIRFSPTQFTDNPYREVSEIAKGLGVYVTCHWENSLPKYIYPGMPCKFYYEHQGTLMYALGEIVGARIVRRRETKRHNDKTLITVTELILHLQASGVVVDSSSSTS